MIISINPLAEHLLWRCVASFLGTQEVDAAVKNLGITCHVIGWGAVQLKKAHEVLDIKRPSCSRYNMNESV